MSVGSQEINQLNDLQIDFFILADRAEAVNGKLYLMGGAWDRYFAQDLEQPLPISFALGILVPWNATNQQHSVRIRIEDLDRNQQMPFTLEAGFVAGRPPFATPGQQQRVILAVPSVPVRFLAHGAYQAVAEIVGGAERRVEFHITPTTTQMAPPMTPR